MLLKSTWCTIKVKIQLFGCRVCGRTVNFELHQHWDPLTDDLNKMEQLAQIHASLEIYADKIKISSEGGLQTRNDSLEFAYGK